MTEQTQLTVFSNTTNPEELEILTDGMLAAMALQNLPEFSPEGEPPEPVALEISDRENVAESLGIASLVYVDLGQQESIVVSLQDRDVAPIAQKLDTSIKFDG